MYSLDTILLTGQFGTLNLSIDEGCIDEMLFASLNQVVRMKPPDSSSLLIHLFLDQH